jgi:hypothetical protein
LQSENRQGSAIVNAVSVRTGCHRAIVIPTIEVGNKESVNYCVAESVILNKYRQHGTIYNASRRHSNRTPDGKMKSTHGSTANTLMTTTTKPSCLNYRNDAAENIAYNSSPYRISSAHLLSPHDKVNIVYTRRREHAAGVSGSHCPKRDAILSDVEEKTWFTSD